MLLNKFNAILWDSFLFVNWTETSYTVTLLPFTGSLGVDVENLYIKSSIVTLSTFIKTSFVRSDETTNINDIDYFLYRRTRTSAQVLASRMRREDEDPDPFEIEILY